MSAKHGVESQGMLGAEVPVSKSVAWVGWGGIQRHHDGVLDLRDATVAVAWIPVRRDDLLVRLQPGVSLPTGGFGGLVFTSLSTASVDPWLGVDVVAGRTWLVGTSAVARVPVYDGWDRVRQGPFLRADGRLARRLGDVVPFVGPSVVRLGPGDPRPAAPGFTELACAGGAVWNLSRRWSATAQLRLPVLVSDEVNRQVSGGLSLRWVLDLARGTAPRDGRG